MWPASHDLQSAAATLILLAATAVPVTLVAASTPLDSGTNATNFKRQLQFAAETDCDITTLDGTISGLNLACCGPGACTGAPPTQCSEGCALVMAGAAYGPCAPALNRALDGEPPNGVSEDLTALWQTCLGLGPEQVAAAIAPGCGSAGVLGTAGGRPPPGGSPPGQLAPPTYLGCFVDRGADTAVDERDFDEPPADFSLLHEAVSP